MQGKVYNNVTPGAEFSRLTAFAFYRLGSGTFVVFHLDVLRPWLAGPYGPTFYFCHEARSSFLTVRDRLRGRCNLSESVSSDTQVSQHIFYIIQGDKQEISVPLIQG